MLCSTIPTECAPNDGCDDDEEEIDTDFYAVGTICAVAPDKESTDMCYFVSIEEECDAEFDVMDDYQQLVRAGQHYLSGHYLEKMSSSPKGGQMYQVNNNKSVFFFPESIIHPFANFEVKAGGKTAKSAKKTLFIKDTDYCDILYFIEQTKMAAIV